MKSLKFILFGLVVLCTQFSYAQTASKFNEKGFMGIAELGYGIGLGYNQGLSSGQLFLTAAYRFNPYFSAGLGTGAILYWGWGDSEPESEDFGIAPFIPLFANFQFNFMDRHIAPYVVQK